jgi:hypothetical protein
VGVYPVHRGRTEGCCYRYFPLVETWDGVTWTASTGAVPSGGSDASLSGVSCTSTTTCVAVGNEITGDGVSPVGETLSGRRWRATALPLPEGDSYPGTVPWTVSCVAESCLAFGADVPGGQAGGLLAERLTAGRWTPTNLDLPPGATYPFPFTYDVEGAVSCVATDSCVAISSDQSNAVPTQVAETFNGVTWSATSLPGPDGASSPTPQGLSCAAAESCVGVGTYSVSGGGLSSLSEMLSGSTWTAGTLPFPAPTPYSSLTALSCPSSSDCIAVGSDIGAGHAQSPFAESQAGMQWTEVPMKLPADAVANGDTTPLLPGLACPTTDWCVAVGYEPGQALSEHPLAEVLSGGKWKPERLPMPRGFLNQSASLSSLSSVSCVAVSSCVAVGTVASQKAALVETLTTGGWSATTVAPPGHSSRVWLSAVSCPAAASCVAVGAYWGSAPGFSRPVSATLSGSTWRTTTLKLPGDARSDVAFTVPLLRAVSCAAITSCTAVGFYPTSFDATAPVVESLSGTTWRATALPGSVNWTLLWSLSCPSAGSCVAVGEGNGLPLAEAMVRGTWSSTAIALPGTMTGASLQAVSCSSTESCTAVGGGVDGGDTLPVVAVSNN